MREPIYLDDDCKPEREPVTVEGSNLDPSELTREELEREAPRIARLIVDASLGRATLTYQQIQACKLVLDKLVPAAVQRVDLRASVEVRDKRATIEALITALSRPGAVVRGADGAPVLNLPATVTEARLARADGKGPPELDATGMPIESDEPTR
jgi:hypothetical protein